jgi:hypothetical protein
MASGLSRMPQIYWLATVIGLATGWPICALGQTQYRVTVLDVAPYTNGFAFGARGGLIAGSGRYPNQNGHAFVWDVVTLKRVDLNPAGVLVSRALGTDGTHAVGELSTPTGQHACVWDIDSGTYRDLHPAGVTVVNSQAVAVDDGQQVGHIYDGAGGRAALWTGTAKSFVDLTPAGAIAASASGVDAGRQVGGFNPPDYTGHAALWFGSAASYIDLHGPGFYATYAYAIKGNVVVGQASLPSSPNRNRAVRWDLSIGNLTDLHPAGWSQSFALATNGEDTVGWGIRNGPRALVWHGTSGQFVDLGAWLPPGIDGAEANGIDEFGNIVGTGYSNAGGYAAALLWSPVPEPYPLFAVFAFLLLGVLIKRHK